MSRRSLVVLVAVSLSFAGCEQIAKIAGAPVGVERVVVTLPTVMLSNDTFQATAVGLNSNGKPDHGDQTATWSSSDPSAISVSATGRVTGSVVGRSATISAKIQGKTGSRTLTIIDDQRLGYALADQPTTAGPYAPDAAYRFNSSGGAIQVTRTSAGIYSVRFAGLGRPGNDNVQVTAYAPVAGSYCNLGGWQATSPDLVADVRCFSATGAPTDHRFTILVSGARPYNSPRFGFLLSPDFGGAQAMSLDSLPTSRNSMTGRVDIGHVMTGDYAIGFPGLERVPGDPVKGGADIELVTAVGAGPEHCVIEYIAPTDGGIAVACTNNSGARADSRFSLIFLVRGRMLPNRWAYAWADRPTSTVDYTPNTGYLRNPTGGTITARETAVGQYRVVFQGLAKPAGATETVMVSAFSNGSEIDSCGITSWGNTGASDLQANVACFNAAGAPANSQFLILVIS